jgi:uncharacterized membrane-anchored protein YitT (DUF2179 family)
LKIEKKHIQLAIDALKILVGNALYSFAVVKLIMPNGLADNATSGFALLVHALTTVNPAYTLALLNVILLFFTRKILHKREWYLSILGAVSLSVFIYAWQLIPLDIDLQGDLLIVALLAGLVQGIGLGIIFRSGGTFGGASLIARFMEIKLDVKVGVTLFIIDILVLTASLIYVTPIKMLYTLIAAFVFAQTAQRVGTSGVPMSGLIIVSDQAVRIAQEIRDFSAHRVTVLEEGTGKSGISRTIVYAVVAPKDVTQIKRKILDDIDEYAFISVFDVQDTFGEMVPLPERESLNLF